MKIIDKIDKYLIESTASEKLIKSQRKIFKGIFIDIFKKLNESEKRVQIINNNFGGSTLFDIANKELKISQEHLSNTYTEINDALNEIEAAEAETDKRFIEKHGWKPAK